MVDFNSDEMLLNGYRKTMREAKGGNKESKRHLMLTLAHSVTDAEVPDELLFALADTLDKFFADALGINDA